MKKIVFLINSLSSGGAEKVISVIITKLVEDGFDIELICLEKNVFYDLPKKVKVTFLGNNNGKSNGFVKLLMLPILAIRLKKYITKNKITLIQSHVYRANYVNILSKLFGSTNTVQVVNAGAISRYLQEGLRGKVNLVRELN